MGKGKDFWLDDPEWEVLRRKVEKRPVSRDLKKQASVYQKPKLKLPPKEETTRITATKQDTPKEVVVSLKLAVPKIKRPSGRMLRQLYRRLGKKMRIALALGTVSLLVVVGTKVITGKDKGKVAGTDTGTAQEQAQATFNPLVPIAGAKDAAGNTANTEFRFDKEKKVLAYSSEYNHASLVVSQQKLPDDFKGNPAKLAAVAESFSATTTIDTQRGTAYIHTDEKTKTQTAIFATDEVLAFVRSNKLLDDDEWKVYINQLKPNK